MRVKTLIVTLGFTIQCSGDAEGDKPIVQLFEKKEQAMQKGIKVLQDQCWLLNVGNKSKGWVFLQLEQLGCK